jgi:hypothetical protein
MLELSLQMKTQLMKPDKLGMETFVVGSIKSFGSFY